MTARPAALVLPFIFAVALTAYVLFGSGFTAPIERPDYAHTTGAFTLRHAFVRGTSRESSAVGLFTIAPQIIAQDVGGGKYRFGAARTRDLGIHRLPSKSRAEMESQWRQARYAKRMGRYDDFQAQFEPLWQKHQTKVPDTEDKDTIILLAEMAANAYVPVPHEGDWTNVSLAPAHTEEHRRKWKHDDGFGWHDDGVRGYVFVSEDSKSIVISIKGTSAAVFDDGGPTAPKDKINDNLFFSCCCARISYVWNTVCDCYLGSYQGQPLCDENCLEDALYDEDHYYRGVLDVYHNITELYPDANIWVTGHSLGGALSAMLGRTYGLPAVTFEAPGEQLAVQRLHLPQPPGRPIWEDHIWHIGHTADPIYTGDCNGASSSCWVSGYAMETRCHSGLMCTYDVVNELGWHSSIANHRIHVVIEDVLRAYNETALCLPAPDCMECSDWDYVDTLDPQDPFHSSFISSIRAPTSTSTSTSSSTSHESVCLTREWYGRCREWGDPTITTGPQATRAMWVPAQQTVTQAPQTLVVQE